MLFELKRSEANFGVTVLALADASSASLDSAPDEPTIALKLENIEGANFSPGTTRPANFPISTALGFEEAGRYLLFTSTGTGIAAHLLAAQNDNKTMNIVGEPCFLRIDEFSPVHLDVDTGAIAVVGVEPPSLALVDFVPSNSFSCGSWSDTLDNDNVASLDPDSRPTGVALANGAQFIALHKSRLQLSNVCPICDEFCDE